METKRCRGCGLEKTVDQFALRSDRKRGKALRSRCRECYFLAHQQWYARNKQLAKVIPETKTCWKCHQTKSSSEFGRSVSHLDGLNPSCKACACAYSKKYRPIQRQRDPHGRRANLWTKFRLTYAQYDAMYVEQNGCCALCHRRFTTTPQVDHCHWIDRVRQLLCSICNTRLARFENRIAAEPDFMRYLERHSSGVLSLHRT
jgi:Recombination endonuclease VII